ncbi:RimJ/RimL family protein N-acetyltransferase [Jatrophihabitans sp. GAS493]|uniref:GNAT family N-acetyltransferase n=1 Tax=Jatrophihabitans sp. GAS493 TaxID=1907575 RepID=UPI000BB6CEE6|nr:GNAT family protein [Jatrophihabitans sp. GAS493]SOD72685.1 RimJ/RimL family protein N-acetyltransferase [Jatrophihabitans sp. GAS493]
MATVRLRPIEFDDLDGLSAEGPEEDPFGFFGFRAANTMQRRFNADGFITDNLGSLAVITPDGELAGTVGWFALQHGPAVSARAFNVGIHILAGQRGRGYGTAAQDEIAKYLFANTLVERLEASTDVENIAEQRALAKAGYQREGLLRHAQFRAGGWHDLVIYSRLRGDPQVRA